MKLLIAQDVGGHEVTTGVFREDEINKLADWLQLFPEAVESIKAGNDLVDQSATVEWRELDLTGTRAYVAQRWECVPDAYQIDMEDLEDLEVLGVSFTREGAQALCDERQKQDQQEDRDGGFDSEDELKQADADRRYEVVEQVTS